MTAFFDTSILVAAFQEYHPDHEPSWRILESRLPSRSYCGAHSWAELYATATGMPKPFRRSREDVLLYLDGLRHILTPITLSPGEYAGTLVESAGRGLTGGAIYDALLAQCALKSGAEVIYTWNLRDFERCGPEVARRLRTP